MDGAVGDNDVAEIQVLQVAGKFIVMASNVGNLDVIAGLT